MSKNSDIIRKCRFCGFEYEAAEYYRNSKSKFNLAIWESLIKSHKIPKELQNGSLGEEGVCCMCLENNPQNNKKSISLVLLKENGEISNISNPTKQYEFVFINANNDVEFEGSSDLKGLSELFEKSLETENFSLLVKDENDNWGTLVGELDKGNDSIAEEESLSEITESSCSNLPVGKNISKEDFDFDMLISGKPVNTIQSNNESKINNVISRPLFATFFGKVPPIEELAFVNIISAINGIFEVRPVGSFIFTKRVSLQNYVPPINEGPVLQTGIYSGLPLIPLSYLTNIVQFFRKVYEDFGSEAIAKIFYSHNDKKFKIWIPRQTVKETTVKWENTGKNKIELDDLLNTSHEWVMDIHSHAGMDAFFSSGAPGTDDEDEKNDGIYGVVGQVGSSSPQIEFRLRIGSTFHSIELSELFDITQSNVDFSDIVKDRINSNNAITTNSQNSIEVTKSTALIKKDIINVSKDDKNVVNKSETYWRVHFVDGTSKVYNANDKVETITGRTIDFFEALTKEIPVKTSISNFCKITNYEEITPSRASDQNKSTIINSSLSSLDWKTRCHLLKDLDNDIITDAVIIANSQE